MRHRVYCALGKKTGEVLYLPEVVGDYITAGVSAGVQEISGLLYRKISNNITNKLWTVSLCSRL